MDMSTWIAFVAASTALLLVPGPTVLLVLAYALSKEQRIAVPTAIGVATGDLIAMTASLAGLGALVLTSASLFTALKWIGACYLVWLGVKMFRGARQASLDLPPASRDLTPRVAFANAAAVTALNPKSLAFFIAFVPQFISAGNPFLPQAIILIATFVTLAGVNALTYALLANRLRAAIKRPSVVQWLTRAGGGMLVAMGVMTATLRRAEP